MDYQTFQPHANLQSLVKCYWTLEIPAQKDPEKQRIIPDGCIEMIFILGDDVKRFTTGKKFILQPRAMILGQTIDPFFVQPTGYVNSFAIRFYPYGFTNFANVAIKTLANKETPIELLFGKKTAMVLERNIVKAGSTKARIKIIETFLLHQLKNKAIVDKVVKETIDTMLATKGNARINQLLKNDPSKRRQLERKFVKQVGLSPKKLGKVIRIQTALKILLNKQAENLTKIAYESDYYDQAHFVRDFKEFTGTTPKGFFRDEKLALSALFYAQD